MKRLNNYARHHLIGRLFMPFCILIVFNLLLHYWSNEDSVKLTVLIISLTFVAAMILVIIFYPKLMDIKVQTLRYDDYLYEVIERYEEWLKTINQRIETAENTSVKHFMIGKKNKQKPEMMAKLLEDARINKAGILQGYQADREEAEKKLSLYKTEKEECVKMLTQYYGKTSHSS
ncbi:MAG: hypothetical protein WAW11_01990 [Patescibacteria group bacterium]